MRISSYATAMLALVAIGCTEAGDAQEADDADDTVAETGETVDAAGCCGPQALRLDAEAADGADAVSGLAAAVDAAFDPACDIEEGRVAGMDIPATFGDFAGGFAQQTTLSFYQTYMVDLSALGARAGGEDAICAIGFYEESYSAETPVEGLIVISELCATHDGIGPGTPVARAAETYGEATYGFSWDNEGREYVSFANAPENYNFRARSATAEQNAQSGGTNIPGGEHGGDYRGVEGDGSYYETATGYPDAVIREIWVSRPAG